MSIIPTDADKKLNDFYNNIKNNNMDIKEKANVLAMAANAVKLPLDLTSAEVLLKISSKIDEVGNKLTMEDIDEIVSPYLTKPNNSNIEQSF